MQEFLDPAYRGVPFNCRLAAGLLPAARCLLPAVKQPVERARSRLMGVMLQELDDVSPGGVILRMREHRRPVARPRERNV